MGVDIKRFYQSILDKDVTNTQGVYYDGAQALYELRVPLICAVHGHCLGGGVCYPAGADISIAVKGTLFGAPEAKLSVVGGSAHLARILPPQQDTYGRRGRYNQPHPAASLFSGRL